MISGRPTWSSSKFGLVPSPPDDSFIRPDTAFVEGPSAADFPPAPAAASTGSSAPLQLHGRSQPWSSELATAMATSGSGSRSSIHSAFERRQGKWTRAECEYAMLLIEHFTSGRLPGCSGGESLRTTLSECLMCTPMRITKKLSATHAIGKCCFKKKGELSAKERVNLEAARHAFLASVEKREQQSSGSSSNNGRKRTRVASDDAWLADSEFGDAASWLCDSNLVGDDDSSRPGIKDDEERRAWMASPHSVPTGEPLAPSVSARVTADGRTKVRVVASDRPGLIGEISAVFKQRGLSIVGCVAETLPGDVAHDEFEIVTTATKQAVTYETELRSLEQSLQYALATGPPIEGGYAERIDDAASETSSVKTKSSDTHGSKKVSATTLQVTVPDRPGLLKQITTSLTSLRLSIVGAKIETVEADDIDSQHKTALDTFDVVDAESGGPVLDPVRLRAIEERLSRDLEATSCNTLPKHDEQGPPAAAPFAPDESYRRYYDTDQPHPEDDSWTEYFSRKYFS